MLLKNGKMTSLYFVFNIHQATKFMQRFHYERMTKLSLILESETWRQAEVPVEFQQLLNQISESGVFSITSIYFPLDRVV